MADEAQVQRQLKFARNFIAQKILEQNDDLREQKLIKAEAEVQRQLNGFMSNIVNLKLTLENPQRSNE